MSVHVDFDINGTVNKSLLSESRINFQLLQPFCMFLVTLIDFIADVQLYFKLINREYFSTTQIFLLIG